MPRNSLAFQMPGRVIALTAFAIGALACSDSSGPDTPHVDARLGAFSSTAGNSIGIGLSLYLMHADGSSKTRLTSEGFLDESPVWSPDGSTIAFDTNRDTAGIWLVKADGTNLRRFITPPAFDQPSGLAWSPESQHQLTTGSQDGSARWSPDGTQIVFDRLTNPSIQLFVMNADGSNQHALTTSGANFGGAWSPNGQQLEFTVIRNNNNQIARMNADGSEARLITKSGTNAFPAWNPRRSARTSG